MRNVLYPQRDVNSSLSNRMLITDTYNNQIHLSLRQLLHEKSARDSAPFTICQLAKALDMPHSMLVKLMHMDTSKRVVNPRIDTLSKIVDFFRHDGFNVTIEDMLHGLQNKKIEDVQTQPLGAFVIEKNVPVYLFHIDKVNIIGTFNVKLTTDTKNIIAYLSDEDIEPIFKKGSLFIVDVDAAPGDGMMVAIKIGGHKKILIRTLHIEKNETVLKGGDNKTPNIILTSDVEYFIVGVVIQVNAKI